MRFRIEPYDERIEWELYDALDYFYESVKHIADLYPEHRITVEERGSNES